MHAVFAVEPKAIDSWTNFRYLIEKFSFPKGVLIARYPKTWMRLVIEACDENGVGEVERLKIVERLREAKSNRMFNAALPFDGGEWLDNALSPKNVNFFDALVIKGDHELPHVYSNDDIYEEVFEDRREQEVLRDAKSLALVARYLFVDNQEIILIDPYLKPRRACTNLLNAFVEESFAQGKGIKRIVIHAAYSVDPSDMDVVVSEYKKYMGDLIDDGLTIQVNRWDDDALDFDFHARYLLAGEVGIRYDRGFIEPSDHDDRAKKTDVGCLETGTVMRLLNRYQVSGEANGIHDVIEIQGE